MPADLPRTARALRAALRQGQLSVREVIQDALDRAQHSGHLGAFTEVRAALALAEADAADQRLRATPSDQRHRLAPLFGLPTAHKDLVRVAGFTTSYGSAAVPRAVARADDPIARLVRAAGAICIAKTQVPEFGIAAYSENLVSAPARNPFDLSRTAGGSSGGTAAAIAAGVIPAAVGSDAGGSIRIPAAACGIVGLKPGRGVVVVDAQAADRDTLAAPHLQVSGPMARTVRDTALFFDAMIDWPGSAATEVRAATGSTALAAVERAEQLRGLRIGVSLASPFAAWCEVRFDAAATATLSAAARVLTAAGHAVEAAEFEYGDGYPAAFTNVWVQALHDIDLVPGGEPLLGELARWFLMRTRGAHTAVSQEARDRELTASVAALRAFARDAAAQWARYDVVLTPSLAFATPEIGSFQRLGAEGDYRRQCEWSPHTSMVNVSGVPAISVPMGTDDDGMPRGVQLIGRRHSEQQLLQLAAQLLDE